MPFRSKAQWRFAFATHKSWARRWAHETPSYRALPRRKGQGSVARRARAKAT
jgi:hypothetical protein